MALLQFEHVTVQYPIYNSRSQSLRNQLVRVATGGRVSEEAGQIITVKALEDVSFTLSDGDTVGLIGHNGAGKTTLLRTMAGIYSPVRGSVIVEGSLSTIIEIGAGMDNELSGYENIFRMGLLLGRTRPEIEALIPGIESLTELGAFLRMPVRTYSSGMTMRLMFAVATSVRPEILLIDEMFGTGDASFQEKALVRIHEMIEGAKIFVFASHDHSLLKRYCRRIFSLKHGSLEEVASF